MNNIYDCLIIGGGPAGLTSAIYLARANKKIAVIEKSVPGGKITETPEVNNIPGFISISGNDFADKLVEQVESLNIEIIYDEIMDLQENDNNYHLYGVDNDYDCKSVIISTGTTNRTLGIDDEELLIGNGISFCVTCDGPFYKNKTVIVVGGGNSAVTEAIELSSIANNVIILQNLSFLTADNILIEKLNTCNNISVKYNIEVTKYLVSDSNTFMGVETNTNETILADGLFLAIGIVPNTKPFSVITKLDKCGYIVVDDDCCANNGIFACGDCANNSKKQVAVACGQGATAALTAIDYLNKEANI